MQQIINFIVRHKITLFYVLLMTIALGLTIQSHSYHKSAFFNSANQLSGSIYSTSSNISSYFDLREENKSLLEENELLRKQLLNGQGAEFPNLDTDSLNYTVIAGKVIKNSYASPRNYITINKGEKQGMAQDMGVITDKGILGILENTSSNYSVVQSILNTKSNINAKIKNTNYFGSLVWNANDYNVVQLVDIPRLVSLTVGDTIVTGAMSSIFPENIPIGTIRQYDLNTSKNFYTIDVQLFNDMANIKNIYVINNINRTEIQQLESQTSNEQ